MKNDVANSKLHLKQIGLELKEIKGDGNCLFRAISDQLFGNEDHHMDLRQKAVEFIKNNQDEARHYIEENKSFEDHVESMSKDGTWGGELEIYAL